MNTVFAEQIDEMTNKIADKIFSTYKEKKAEEMMDTFHVLIRYIRDHHTTFRGIISFCDDVIEKKRHENIYTLKFAKKITEMIREYAMDQMYDGRFINEYIEHREYNEKAANGHYKEVRPGKKL